MRGLNLSRRALLAAPLSLATASAKPFFHKGVNFTAEWPDHYGSAKAVEMIQALPGYGVNSIALVPYGFARKDEPSVRWGRGYETSESIVRIAAVAKEHKIRVMLKPQIWLRGGWPGDIHFELGSDRDKWFAEYAGFLDVYANLAKRIEADVFCIGTEFGKMSKYTAGWRRLIARARQLYSGPLTYAASQGPDFENSEFWDGLDYIGLNNYYPLPDSLATAEMVAKVETVQKKFRKPVIFPEAGYCSYEAPHRAPWDETPRKLAPEHQAKCYEALLSAFYSKPWFQGVYFWKVGSNGFGGLKDGSHTPWGKPAMDVMARWYRNGTR